MTVGALVFCIFMTVVIIIAAAGFCAMFEEKTATTLAILVLALIIMTIWGGCFWYYGNTASGRRAMIDEKSELRNGLERTITVYTADGKIIAQYTGVIDIEGKDGGYVVFDFDGKRYTYYNCLVESIAEIDG